MLAREAGVSKTTLYKYFPNMSAVLNAVVEAEAENFETGVPTECASCEELRDALSQYGANLLAFLNNPEIIEVTKLLHEEARAHPDLAAEFYNAAYGRTQKVLSAMIEQGKRDGYIDRPLTSDEMAEQLLGMWEPLRWTRAILGLIKKPYTSPKDWATKCVDTLLG